MNILRLSALLLIGFPTGLGAQRPTVKWSSGEALPSAVMLVPSAVVSHPRDAPYQALAVVPTVDHSLAHRIGHFAKIGGIVGGIAGVVTGLVVSHYVGCNCGRVPAPVQFAGFYGLEGLVLGAGTGALVGLIWPDPGGVGARQLPNEALLLPARAVEAAGLLRSHAAIVMNRRGRAPRR